MQQTTQATTSALVEIERQFVLEAWAQRLRPDKRLFQQLRDVSIEFPVPADRGVCLVKLGKTAVMASVACEVVEPTSSFSRGGFLDFHVKHHHGASRSGELPSSNTTGLSDVTEITRMLEAVIKTAKAIDVESLSIIIGKYCWSIRVDVNILNDEGNVLDAAIWSSVVALQHVRRPEVSIQGGTDNIIIHPINERDPIPLSVHHCPITITSAIVSNIGGHTPTDLSTDNNNNNGTSFVLDPSIAECAAAGGLITIAVNKELQVCDVHKHGAADMSLPLLKQCISACKSVVPQLIALMKDAMDNDERKRKEAAVAQFQWAKKRTGVSKA
eukprot:Tbor_TRINITY_DN5643_c5_g1::TRINITY_DN5643_c5_g1_i1::g.8975::m.8975/K03678/RRP45, EXOSC9; exosome complex component RRP45